LSTQVRDELSVWLQTREQLHIEGKLVFPANLEGEALDPSTVYRVIERQLAAVGAGKRGAHKTSGSQLLRAGVAHRLNTGKHGKSIVKQTLGHRQMMSTVDLLERLDPIEAPTKPASTT
jgi:integrase